MSHSLGGRWRQYDARTLPATFIHGPKMAAARPASELWSTPIAIPDAMPAFCSPTSIDAVRESDSLRREPARAPVPEGEAHQVVQDHDHEQR